MKQPDARVLIYAKPSAQNVFPYKISVLLPSISSEQLKKIIDNVNDGLPSEHLHADQGYAALMTLYTHSAFRDNYYENRKLFKLLSGQ